MGRTNVVLDDEILAACMEATGLRTRRALIDHALRELLRRKRQTKVLELKGAIRWDGDLESWRAGRGAS